MIWHARQAQCFMIKWQSWSLRCGTPSFGRPSFETATMGTSCLEGGSWCGRPSFGTKSIATSYFEGLTAGQAQF